MTVQETTSREAPLESARARRFQWDFLSWPGCVWPLALILFLLYLPVFRENTMACLRSPDFTHGVLIPPVALLLVWMRRGEIAAAERRPVFWGLALMAFGLLIMVFSYILRISFFGLWSLIPVLAGAVLALHGRALWRITSFPILYLFWAGPIPRKIYFPFSFWIQNASTRGAASIMQMLGYIVLRNGNQIEIPGYALEVADVCSGFQKLVALNAFALVYGYMFNISWSRRLLLLLSAYPIALLANTLRIAALVGVVSMGGLPAFNIAHEYADMVALALSFGLFVLTGRLLGCKKLRF